MTTKHHPPEPLRRWGGEVRWTLWPSAPVNVGVRPHPYIPPVLALLVHVATSFSPEAELHPTNDSAPLTVARQFAHGLRNILSSAIDSSEEFLKDIYWRAREGRLAFSDIAWCGALVCAIQGFIIWKMAAAAPNNKIEVKHARQMSDRPSSLWAAWKVNPAMEAESSDPGLLQKFSSFNSYKTSKATYPSIRTFYRPHSQADKLPNTPTRLPLLVFVHGLGGCLSSFSPILTSLVNIAPCLGIDFPGCGRSGFSPTTWNAYTTEALAELLSVVIKEHCSTAEQGVILIGHSMGCSLSLLAATSYLASPKTQDVKILSLIGVCPQAAPPSGKLATRYTMLLRIPTIIFDIMRTFDRRKGTNSASVIQFAGKDSSLELRRIQVKYNKQSRTPVFRRMAWGALSRSSGSKSVAEGLPGLETWGQLKVPLFLIAGEGDAITKPEEVTKIGQALGKATKPSTLISSKDSNDSKGGEPLSNTQKYQPSLEEKRLSIVSTTEITVLDGAPNLPAELPNGTQAHSRRRQVLKTSVLPYPASHALLYDPAMYRTLAGLIQTFLSDHVDTRLSLGWQLQHLSTEGKWDVKNLAKWQAIKPVSDPIAGIFRAMKTLREVDNVHSPERFVGQWKGKIKAVIDISHESPVYDPKGLDEGGIEYHKFPTVSKIPPTVEEVKDFVSLVDKLRTQPPISTDNNTALIGVHCHYGFNRTGFFICCYLIEKEKYGVQQAIDIFAKRRPNGIKHAHFLDQLFVRYCVGLKRAPTL